MSSRFSSQRGLGLAGKKGTSHTFCPNWESCKRGKKAGTRPWKSVPVTISALGAYDFQRDSSDGSYHSYTPHLCPKCMKARNNPAPVVVAAIIQAFLPLIMSLGSKQINAYKKASTEDQIKMLKKWSMFLSPPVRLALQHKKSARNIATKLSALLNDPETMANLKEAGKAGIEVGQAYRGAKAKKNGDYPVKPSSENHRRTLKWYKAHPYYLLAMKLDSASESYKKEGGEWAYRELVRFKKTIAAYDAALNEMTDRKALVRLSNRIHHHVRKIDALFRSGNPYAAKKNGPTLGKPHYPFAEKEKQYAKYTTEALYHAMNDAMAASKAQQGWNEAGANWYLDDYHTIVKEIQRRKRRG